MICSGGSMNCNLERLKSWPMLCMEKLLQILLYLPLLAPLFLLFFYARERRSRRPDSSE